MHRPAAGHLDIRRVAVVAGIEDDHLVARADEGEHGGEDRLGRACGHRDIGRRVVTPWLGREGQGRFIRRGEVRAF